MKSRFVYGEVWAHSELSIKQRLLVSIAALVTVQGEELLGMLHAALRNEVTPEELQEVFHQAAPYIGFAKAEKGLHVLKKAFDEAGVKLPLGKQSTVTEETRLESGISAQKALFGPVIDLMRANAPEDQRFMQDYLSAFCFGDTYTRGALDLKTRELLTFVCIISLGGCDSQAKAHVGGNLMAGNGKTVLVSAAAQCLPYIGFPRTLNALAAISEMTKPKEEAK
ncbi:hypothetical protein SDC9_155620 [bioreactor metagenome]|uniref:Carboxymuconolactone decarboxylase-like domain-containing protein n=1 Tax=bioreactor metagenome TaxID=1076179 RepID=A0A645F1Z0_9ZZZZ